MNMENVLFCRKWALTNSFLCSIFLFNEKGTRFTAGPFDSFLCKIYYPNKILVNF